MTNRKVGRSYVKKLKHHNLRKYSKRETKKEYKTKIKVSPITMTNTYASLKLTQTKQKNGGIRSSIQQICISATDLIFKVSFLSFKKGFSLSFRRNITPKSQPKSMSTLTWIILELLINYLYFNISKSKTSIKFPKSMLHLQTCLKPLHGGMTTPSQIRFSTRPQTRCTIN